MAGLKLALTSPSVVLQVNGSPFTMLQVGAPAQQRVLVKELSASFNGTSNTQAEVLVDVVQQTSAGTGLTANNPTKWNAGDPETVQSTGQTFTSTTQTEPAGTTKIFEEYVHPQTGFLWQAPFGGEMVCPGGKFLGLRVTNTQALNGVFRMILEE